MPENNPPNFNEYKRNDFYKCEKKAKEIEKVEDYIKKENIRTTNKIAIAVIITYLALTSILIIVSLIKNTETETLFNYFNKCFSLLLGLVIGYYFNSKK